MRGIQCFSCWFLQSDTRGDENVLLLHSRRSVFQASSQVDVALSSLSSGRVCRPVSINAWNRNVWTAWLFKTVSGVCPKLKQSFCTAVYPVPNWSMIFRLPISASTQNEDLAFTGVTHRHPGCWHPHNLITRAGKSTHLHWPTPEIITNCHSDLTEEMNWSLYDLYGKLFKAKPVTWKRNKKEGDTRIKTTNEIINCCNFIKRR